MSDLVEQLELSENPTVEAITRLIGEELALRLFRDLGGKIIYIPLTAGQHSPITVSIGIEAAERLSKVYGGLRYQLPTVPARDAEIFRLYNSGVSILGIAHQMRLSRYTVAGVIDKRLNSTQADLFSGL